MIGKLLKYVRKQKGFSQEELGKLVNLNRTTLGNYETEYRQATFETIEEIVNKCDYEIYFINNKTNDKLQLNDLKRKDI